MKKFIVFLVLFGIIIFVGLTVYYRTNIVPPEFARYATDWPMANHDYSNTREYLGAGIDSANVAKLGLAWSFPIKGISEWGAATTNPIILGNTVYFQDLKSNVYSVDLATGKQNWMKEYNQDIAGPNGLAIGWGKIFAQVGHYNLAGLTLSGVQIWSTTLAKNNTGIDVQPSIYDHTVYTSSVPGINNEKFYLGGNVGTIYAVDELTGSLKWSFDTVDTADVWGNAGVNSGGGAWYPPAIDLVRKVMYWGIGNPAPWPGTKDFPNGTSRPGNNLYTSSLVALNQKDGKLLWYNQVAPHDLYDYDFQASPILASLKIAGKLTDIVIGAGKMGKVVAMDRDSGKTLWTTLVGTHLNYDLKVLPKGTTKVSPGPLGGVETMLAYSDGVVYAPNVDMTVEYTAEAFNAKSFNLAAGKGELTAIDAATGKILWVKFLDSLNVGAATVVNDLVFTSTFNGKIYAFNKKTGEQVWTYQAPGGINGWPAVTGDMIVFPVGEGKTPVLLGFKIGSGLAVPVTPAATPATGKGFQQ
jgi:glucose dehydrogenase